MLLAINPAIAAVTTDTPSHIDPTGQLRRLTEVQELWEAADIDLENGEIETAIETLSKAIQLAPNDSDLFSWRAELYLDIERFTEAIEDFETAIQKLPGSALAHGNLGWTLILDGSLKASRQASLKAHELDPVAWEWIFNLGHTYLLSGDADTARHFYKQALPLIPELSELEYPPWADFQLFVDRGWSVETANKVSQWVQAGYPDYAAHRTAISLMYSTIDHFNNYQYGDSLRTSQLASLQLDQLFDPTHMIMAWAAYYEGYSYYLLGAYTQAEKHFRKAVSIPMQVLGADSPHTADFINDLAVLYVAMGDYSRAEPLYERSLKISRNALGPDHNQTGVALHNLGQLYDVMGRYTQAEPLLLESLAISEKRFGPRDVDVAMGLDSLAQLYHNKGDYAYAEQLYIRALDITEEVLGPDDLGLNTTLNNLALLYGDLGDYERARPLFERSLSITETVLGHDHLNTAIVIHNIAQLHHEIGEYEEAELLYKEGISIAEKTLGSNHPEMAIDFHSLATLYNETQDYQQAQQLYERALRISESILGADHPQTIGDILDLAALYQDMGDSSKAQSLYSLIPPIAVPGRSPELLAYLQYGWASFYANEGEIVTAIFHGKQAVNTLQGFRGTLTDLDKRLQSSFTKSRSYIYRDLADWLIDSGRLVEAQQVLAMLKEDEYFHFIHRAATDDPRKTRTLYTGIEEPWAKRYEEINARMVTISLEYENLRKQSVFGLSPSEERRSKQLEDDMRVGRIAFISLQEQMRTDFMAQGIERAIEFTKKEVDPDSQDRLRGMLQKLGGDTALLTYLVTDESLRIILTTPSAPPIHRETRISAKDLRHQIYEFRDILQNPRSSPLPAAQNLYDVLIAPVEADLRQAGTQILMLQPDDTLRYVPYAALYDGDKYLVQNYALSIYTPAAGPLIQQAPSEHWRVAGLGLTGGALGFAPLPYVSEELDAIIKEADVADSLGIVDGVIRIDDEFTSDELSNLLARRKYNVVHLATHFVFRPGTESDSYLVLGNGEKLSLKDLRLGNYPFFDLDLITLSACETAVGSRNADGREIEGFAAMAQNRGAASVLATLWSVADVSTGYLMVRFYALHENAGFTKTEALRQAQLEFLKMGTWNNGGDYEFSVPGLEETGIQISEIAELLPHPYFWAPFILMGNWL